VIKAKSYLHESEHQEEKGRKCDRKSEMPLLVLDGHDAVLEQSLHQVSLVLLGGLAPDALRLNCLPLELLGVEGLNAEAAASGPSDASPNQLAR